MSMKSQDPLTDVYPVGTRVYAIRENTPTQVFVYGFGVYEGQFPLEEGLEIQGPMGPVLVPPGTKNPRIKLDSGETIWGYQCWWGREEGFQKKFSTHEVVPVSISAELEEHQREQDQMRAVIEKASEIVKGTQVGVTGDAQIFERDGQKFIVVSAYIWSDMDGNIQDPDKARVKRHSDAN